MTESTKAVHDVFISYASEDRDVIAQLLADTLIARGVSVWFDQFSLQLGDSIRRKIDEGLTGSRYGVVILSTSFFEKHFTKLELDGLAQREVNGEKVILPVWLGVDEHQVRRFSPMMADRKAARFEDGFDSVLTSILEVVRPDIPERLRKVEESKLSRIKTGKALVALFSGTHFAFLQNDEPQDEFEADLVGGFLQEVHDWADIWYDIEVDAHVRAEMSLTGRIKELEAAGWTLYGVKLKGKRKIGGVVGEWVWYVAAVLKGEPAAVLTSDDHVIVLRNPQEPGSPPSK